MPKTIPLADKREWLKLYEEGRAEASIDGWGNDFRLRGGRGRPITQSANRLLRRCLPRDPDFATLTPTLHFDPRLIDAGLRCAERAGWSGRPSSFHQEVKE